MFLPRTGQGKRPQALRAAFMQRSGSKSAVESLEREMEMIASTETCRWPDLLPLLTIAAAAVSTPCHRWGLCSTKSLLVCVHIQVSPDHACATCGLSSMARHPPLFPWEPAPFFPPCPALLRSVDTDGRGPWFLIPFRGSRLQLGTSANGVIRP